MARRCFTPSVFVASPGSARRISAAGRRRASSFYRKVYKDRFFYQLYFQEPGVAEAELEADVRRSLRMVYYAVSGEGQKAGYRIENPTGPGWLDRYVDRISCRAG